MVLGTVTLTFVNFKEPAARLKNLPSPVKGEMQNFLLLDI